LWWDNGSSHTLEPPLEWQFGPDARHRFGGWQDVPAANRSVTAAGPLALTATFEVASYRAALTTDPPGLALDVDGVATVAPVEQWWQVGSSHVVLAVSPQGEGDTRNVFLAWSDAGQRTHIVHALQPHDLVASFATEYRVVVDTDPAGVDVTVDGQTLPTPASFWWGPADSHTLSARRTAEPAAGTRLTFTGWQDTPFQNRTVSATGPLRFVAGYETSFRVDLVALWGSTQCDRPDCWYPAGALARITAHPAEEPDERVRHMFVHFAGAVVLPDRNATVLVDGPLGFQAVWQTQYLLSVTTDFAGAAGAGWYNESAQATVRLSSVFVSTQEGDFGFLKWSGASDEPTANVTLRMDQPMALRAVWGPVEPPPGPEEPAQAGPGVPAWVGVALLAGAGAFAAVARRSKARGR
jgi:hypothetical protein